LNITALKKLPSEHHNIEKSNKTGSLQNDISKMPSTRGGNYIDNDGYEVELNNKITTHTSNTSKPLQRDYSRRTSSKVTSSSRESSRHSGPVDMGGPIENMGPIDLDDIFDQAWSIDEDDASLFSSSDDEDSAAILDTAFMESQERRYFSNPNKHLLDTDASLIPGSPFSKPPNKPSNRPNAPLSLAKYASTLAFLLTVGWVGSLFFFAIWNYTTISRIM
jgi:hypothetical protein